MFLFLSAPWHTENPQRSKVTGEDSNSTGSEEKEGEGEVAGKDGTLWSEGRIVIIYFVMEREKMYIPVDGSCIGQSRLHFLRKRNAGKWFCLEPLSHR